MKLPTCWKMYRSTSHVILIHHKVFRTSYRRCAALQRVAEPLDVSCVGCLVCIHVCVLLSVLNSFSVLTPSILGQILVFYSIQASVADPMGGGGFFYCPSSAIHLLLSGPKVPPRSLFSFSFSIIKAFTCLYSSHLP